MAREFRLPDIGEGLTEAEIVRWLVPVGGLVAADEPVVEVETDKAVVEIPSPYAGVVIRHGGAEGETVAVGSVLVVIGDSGEAEAAAPDSSMEPERPAEQHRVEPPTVSVSVEPTPPSDTVSAPIVGNLGVDVETLSAASAAPVTSSAPTVKALPLVRKLARDNEIDLGDIRGTGPGGRITREDVETAMRTAPQTPATPPRDEEVSPTEADYSTRPLEPAPVADETDDVPAPESEASEAPSGPEDVPVPEQRRALSRLRRTIAVNMTRSWAEIPHVTTFDDVDATRLLEVREALGARHGVKVPVEALVVKAIIPVLRAFPDFNSTLDGDDLVTHGSYDIGIAVDTPDGLLVAVIRDAASKSVLDLSTEVRRLGEGGKERSLGPDELGGQSFTVSNIGALGGGHGTPIVPPATTAILSVGMAREKPIARDGAVVVAPVMPLSLSYDHRVIDGGQGRRFMALLIENLEEPALFLAE